MGEYVYDELSMAMGFALFGVRMAENQPTNESYRSDEYASSPLPASAASISPKKSSFKKHGSGGSVKFADASVPAPAVAHEHYEIPDEDITTYTEEEKMQFETFSKAKSAYLNFGGVYDDEGELYGENFDIPANDGPAYTEDEIIKFDLFQKAKSACIQFDGVYDSDEEFEGENLKAFNEGDSEAEEYSEAADTIMDTFQRTPSAFVQFGVYDDDEEDEEETFVNEMRFQNIPAKGKQPVKSSPTAPTLGTVQEEDTLTQASASEGGNGEKPSGSDGEAVSADNEGDDGLVVEGQVTGLADSESNELDDKPTMIKSRQGSITLVPIAEGRESEECSPVPTPVPE